MNDSRIDRAMNAMKTYPVAVTELGAVVYLSADPDMEPIAKFEKETDAAARCEELNAEALNAALED